MRVMEGEGFSFLECYIIIYINILGDQPTSHLDRSAVVECEWQTDISPVKLI